jgi:predicted nucleotidyltransferase
LPGGAHSLRVFGSIARGEANENSDLDLLVTWEPGRSLMDHAGLVQDLQDLLGMKVHVGTEKSFTGMCVTGSFARRRRCEGLIGSTCTTGYNGATASPATFA